MNRKAAPGLTLVELMIALAVSGILAVAVFSIYIMSVRATSEAVRERDVLHEASVAVDQLLTIIRAASRIYGNTLVTADKSNSAMLEVSGDPGGGWGRYRYYVNNSQLLRANTLDGFSAGEGRLVAHSVDAVSFTYFDGGNARLAEQPSTPPSDPATVSGASVRRITFEISFKKEDITPGESGRTEYVARTSATLRND